MAGSIRERDASLHPGGHADSDLEQAIGDAFTDRRTLLAAGDALAEAVEAMADHYRGLGGPWVAGLLAALAEWRRVTGEGE